MKQVLPGFGRVTGAVVLAAASCLGRMALAADSVAPMTIIPEYHKMARQAASPAQLFAILDADDSAQIDSAEWQIRKMAIFYMRDRNNDLQLNPDELPGLSHAQFSAADSNGDALYPATNLTRPRSASSTRRTATATALSR